MLLWHFSYEEGHIGRKIRLRFFFLIFIYLNRRESETDEKSTVGKKL